MFVYALWGPPARRKSGVGWPRASCFSLAKTFHRDKPQRTVPGWWFHSLVVREDQDFPVIRGWGPSRATDDSPAIPCPQGGRVRSLYATPPRPPPPPPGFER